MDWCQIVQVLQGETAFLLSLTCKSAYAGNHRKSRIRHPLYNFVKARRITKDHGRMQRWAHFTAMFNLPPMPDQFDNYLRYGQPYRLDDFRRVVRIHKNRVWTYHYVKFINAGKYSIYNELVAATFDGRGDFQWRPIHAPDTNQHALHYINCSLVRTYIYGVLTGDLAMSAHYYIDLPQLTETATEFDEKCKALMNGEEVKFDILLPNSIWRLISLKAPVETKVRAIFLVFDNYARGYRRRLLYHIITACIDIGAKVELINEMKKRPIMRVLTTDDVILKGTIFNR